MDVCAVKFGLDRANFGGPHRLNEIEYSQYVYYNYSGMSIIRTGWERALSVTLTWDNLRLRSIALSYDVVYDCFLLI